MSQMIRCHWLPLIQLEWVVCFARCTDLHSKCSIRAVRGEPERIKKERRTSSEDRKNASSFFVQEKISCKNNVMSTDIPRTQLRLFLHLAFYKNNARTEEAISLANLCTEDTLNEIYHFLCIFRSVQRISTSLSFLSFILVPFPKLWAKNIYRTRRGEITRSQMELDRIGGCRPMIRLIEMHWKLNELYNNWYLLVFHYLTFSSL